MSPEYIQYFQNLLEKYSESGFMQQLTSILKEQEKTLQIKLRADAKYFLFMNFRDMVYNPMEEYTDKSLKQDIPSILKYAQSLSREKEISAHSILRSVHDLWKTLILVRGWF